MERLDLWERSPDRDDCVTCADPDPHSRALRKHRFSLADQAYSITTVVMHRQHLLDGVHGDAVVSSVRWLVEQDRISLYAFVVMPDHLHLVLAPHRAFSLEQVMKTLKGFSAREVRKVRGEHGPVWQDGYHDRAIRGPRDAWDARIYIENNPVRAGMVDRAEAFRLSSANPEFSSMIDPID